MKQKEYNKDTEIDYVILIYTFPRALYTPPVKPWEPRALEVRCREARPRAKSVTGAKS